MRFITQVWSCCAGLTGAWGMLRAIAVTYAVAGVHGRHVWLAHAPSPLLPIHGLHCSAAALYGCAEAIDTLLGDDSLVTTAAGQPEQLLRDALLADSQGHHRWGANQRWKGRRVQGAGCRVSHCRVQRSLLFHLLPDFA